MKNSIILENFYGRITHPVAAIDESGKIIYINKAYSELWGVEMHELAEYNLFDDKEIQKKEIIYVIKEVLNGRHSKIITNYSDSILKQRHPAVPIISSQVFKVMIDENHCAVLLHKNDTDITLLEAEIKKASESENEAERLRSTFLSVLSHEMRTPLNIIMGYTSILKETLADKLTEEEKSYFNNLHGGSERLLKSISQILEFAQIEADQYHITTSTINLNELIEKNLFAVSNLIDNKKVTIKKNFPSEKILVSADEQNLNNVIDILLNNAVKFTNQGFIEIELSIIAERELAMCKVKDTGVGISADYLEHIFLPFSQEDLKIGRNYEGNGLGLALAKRYIEKMEGSLLVDSIKGVGSTFTFTLPLAKHPVIKEPIKKEKKKILIIDEYRESFTLLEAFLKSEYELTFSNMHSIDLNEYQTNNFDIIIFDINPSLWEESNQFGETLRNNFSSEKPILVISSEFSSNKINLCKEKFASAFLIKPFSKSNIINFLQKIEKEN